MYDDLLNKIRNQLATNEPFKESSFVVDPYVESDWVFLGPDDSYPSWAYVRLVSGGHKMSLRKLNKDKYNNQLRERARVVISAECLDKEKAVKSIGSQLLNLGHNLMSISTNNIKIYQEEADGKLKKDMQMVMFELEVVKDIYFNQCDSIICKDCC